VSINFCARRVTAQQMAWVVHDPDRAVDVMFCEADSDELLDFDDPTTFQINTVWHVLGFLLTGEREERCGLATGLFGGTPVRPLGQKPGFDEWLGGVRLLTPDEVSQVAADLAAVDRDELRARWDPAAMEAADVVRWLHAQHLGVLDAILGHLDRLAAFYADAAREGQAVLLDVG
jgi:hypothetical protein